jgi:hypothetical protein
VFCVLCFVFCVLCFVFCVLCPASCSTVLVYVYFIRSRHFCVAASARVASPAFIMFFTSVSTVSLRLAIRAVHSGGGGDGGDGSGDGSGGGGAGVCAPLTVGDVDYGEWEDDRQTVDRSFLVTDAPVDCLDTAGEWRRAAVLRGTGR